MIAQFENPMDLEPKIMEITFKLDRNEYFAACKYSMTRGPVRTRGTYVFCYSTLLIICFLSTFQGRQPFAAKLVWFLFYAIISVGGVFLFTTLFKTYLIRRMLPKSKVDTILCLRRVTLTEHEIIETTPLSETRRSWIGIDRIEETETSLFIFLPTHAFYLIPKRAFRDKQESARFGELARAYLARSASRPIPAHDLDRLDVNLLRRIYPTTQFDDNGMSPVERVFMQPESPRADQRP
jgi:hypothetical protein